MIKKIERAGSGNDSAYRLLRGIWLLPVITILYTKLFLILVKPCVTPDPHELPAVEPLGPGFPVIDTNR